MEFLTHLLERGCGGCGKHPETGSMGSDFANNCFCDPSNTIQPRVPDLQKRGDEVAGGIPLTPSSSLTGEIQAPG